MAKALKIVRAGEEKPKRESIVLIETKPQEDWFVKYRTLVVGPYGTCAFQ